MVDAKGFINKNRTGTLFSKKFLWILTGIIVFFVATVGFSLYFEYIEAKEIGEAFAGIFLKNLIVRSIVQTAVFFILFVVVLGNIIILRRNLAVLNVERLIFDKLKFSALLSVVAAFILSGIVSSSLWEKLLMFGNSQAFGQADPIFGLDIGYFVFERPFLESVTESLFGLWLFVTGFTFVIYWFLGTVFDEYSTKEFFGFKRILIHNVFNVIVLLAINCFTYKFKAEGILFGNFGELQGAGFTARNIWLNFYRIVPVFIIVLTILFLLFVSKGKRKAALKTVLVYPVFVILAAVIAFLVQAVVVAPNEVIRESENISYNIEYTQKAFGIDEISEVVYEVKDNLTADDLSNHSEITDNIRILDLSANLTVLNQIQGIRNYYQFNETDIVPYEIDGRKTAVAITAREITKENLNDTADTYLNRKLRYTHGFGVTVNAINKVTQQGQPEFLIKDIPPKSSAGMDEVKQPRIYYGELTNDYVIVGNEKYKELDYSENQEDIEFSYDGNGGVRLSPMMRVVFAARYGDIRLLVSDLVSSKSRILINRNVTERLRKAAPFFSYDQDPYIIIDKDGGLKWVVDAYTTTDKYPYSQSIGGINYIRNSVKGVVDAYSGEVKFYFADNSDPIAKAYSSMYPGLFEKGDIPEDIKEHIKYPESLFNIQAEVYGKYHISNPSVFYNKNDNWVIAKERYGTTTDEHRLAPYYNMMKLEGAPEEELLLTVPYTLNNKDNMVAWLAVRNEWDNYGQLQIYKFPKDVNIYGPMQVENRINADINISKELNLWSQGGSMVIRGNMIVVPIEESILYVEPIYIASSNKTTLPELKQVVVAYDEKIVMESTLEGALFALFGEKPLPDNEVKLPEENNENTPSELPSYETAARRVIEEFEKMKKASADNNWNAFGNAMEALEKSVNNLESSISSN